MFCSCVFCNSRGQCTFCILYTVHFTILAAADITDIPPTPISPQQLLGRRQRSGEEECSRKKPRITPQTSSGEQMSVVI